MERTDRELVGECLAGSRQAFEALVDRYQRVIFNVAYRMVNNYEEAEDITQAVFIKGFENMKSFNPRYKFFSWLYRIAVNESLNVIRARKRMVDLSPGLVSTGKTPEEAYGDAELGAKIGEALMQLDPDYRIVIVLKHLRECSYKEISDILEIPEKTVKSRLFTARMLLRGVLVEKGIVGNDR
jgi:RNA polymerase sigma-70 factor (ECF subfamily)